jgi:hypothetical protein
MTPRDAAEAILAEYHGARSQWPPMQSGHEGYAVILEELDELWQLVKANRGNGAEARAEAMQIGAMALAYMAEVGPADPFDR